MLGRVLSRVAATILALLTLAMGLLTLRGALADDPALRTVARVLFALALAHGAWASWNAPKRRGPKQRRRLLEILSILADPQLQRDFAESSPAIPAPMALIEDWQALASTLDDPEVAACFDEVELRELLTLREELDRLRVTLPDLEPFTNDLPAEVDFLREDPTWLRLTERADRTYQRFAARDPAA